jgi:hypothetical protein
MIPPRSLSGGPSAPEKPAAEPRGRRLTKKQVRRAALSLSAVVIVLILGTVGFYFLAGAGWVDSLYFECMLATGQGPPFALTNNASKLFASGMAFLSVGTVVTTVVLNLGPIVGQLWREGVEHAERELRKVEEEVVDEFKGR